MVRIIYSDEVPEMLTSGRLSSRTEQNRVYNVLDCCLTAEVLEAIRPGLDEVTHPIYRFERDLMGPVLEMNLRGVRVDQVQRAKMIAELRADSARVQHNLDRVLAEGLGITGFNWNSPPQLKELLYGVLRLPEQKYQGQTTTNRDALEKLRVNFYGQFIINHILVLRDLKKTEQTLSTSVDPDGRIRTTYGIAATETWRFASYGSPFDTGGNLQNWAKKVRRILIADPGCKFAYIDLKSGESYAIGAKCWNTFYDPITTEHGTVIFPGLGPAAGRYLDAVESGDIHTSVARQCFKNLPWTGDIKVDKAIASDNKFYRDKSYRDLTKVLGHGTNYWGQPPSMSKHTKIPVGVIEEFQKLYLGPDGFPEIRMYHNWVAQEIATKGYMINLMGFRRYFFGRRNDDSTIREAIAFDPQSSLAIIMNKGLLNTWRQIRTYNFRPHIQILLQVHDALLIQYPEDQEDQLIPELQGYIQQHMMLKNGRALSIPTDVEVGWNWGPHAKDNPDGMTGYKGHDERERQQRPEVSLLDRRLS